MKLNSAQLEAFLAISRTLHFTKAAEALHVTQSALSQRIAKLEDELETTLFIRDRAALRLTEAGEKLLRFCQLNEQAESDLLESLRGSQTEFAGVLRIGGFSSVNRSLVVPALKKILIENPRLSLQLVTREMFELAPLLKRAEVDYVINDRADESGELESVFLGFEDNVLMQSKKRSVPDVFLDHDEHDPTTKTFLAQNKIKIKPTCFRYLDDVYGLVDGVKLGLGKAVLPLHFVESEKDLEILFPEKKLRVPVYLHYFAQPYYRRLHQVFVEEIRAHFRERLRQS